MQAKIVVAAFTFAVFTALAAPGTSTAQDAETANLPAQIRELQERVRLLEQALNLLTSSQAARPREQSVAVDSPDQVPPSSPSSFTMPPELIPDVGKIGAQVGLLLSGSSNPFGLNRGNFVGGFIDLPLYDSKLLRGKIAYEIMIGMSQSNTVLQTTSNVAQVANLAVLNTLNPLGGLSNVNAAVTGTGPAPFPVTTSGTTRLRLLQVVPFSIKYSSVALDRWRLRPYALLGFGTYVTIHHQNPARGNPPSFGIRTDANLPPDVALAVNQLFGGKAPFGGPLVAGQIAQSPELQARGLPGGHGNLDVGIIGGFGFEYRLSRSLSLGFDSRYNRIASSPGLLITYGTRIGVHF
ncbi:MAG: hypothetical protein H7Y20_04990 [Bryobacteraceae bacterium]|nr:hypothetical protein [Bryobacteraceae bacterium]